MLDNRKKSILVTVVDYDPDDPEEYAYWQHRYGTFAMLQGDGGVNMVVSLAKVLQKFTGASLFGVKRTAQGFVDGIKADMGYARDHAQMVRIVQSLTPEQLASISDSFLRKHF